MFVVNYNVIRSLYTKISNNNPPSNNRSYRSEEVCEPEKYKQGKLNMTEY